jgi:hypothetical protein
MDDGTFVKTGVRIAAYNFTLEENKRLIEFLKIRYNLDCTIQIMGCRPCIYIKANSLKRLQELVKPHILPSMLYKIGLDFKK